MRWVNLGWTNRRIPVNHLKSLHHHKKVHFVDETDFQGPKVDIYDTCTDIHGDKHRFEVEVEGKISTNDNGESFFKAERARYLLERIPHSLRGYYREHYAEIVKKNLDSITPSRTCARSD